MGRQEVIVTPLEKAIIAQVIRRYEALGWSERRLAIAANITPSTVHRMLSGSQNLTLAYLEKIAKVFNLKTSQLISESEKTILGAAKLGETVLGEELAESPTPPTTPPLSDEYITQLEQDLTSGKYAYAAYTTPHNPADEIDSVGEESQIPDGWEE